MKYIKLYEKFKLTNLSDELTLYRFYQHDNLRGTSGGWYGLDKSRWTKDAKPDNITKKAEITICPKTDNCIIIDSGPYEDGEAESLFTYLFDEESFPFLHDLNLSFDDNLYLMDFMNGIFCKIKGYDYILYWGERQFILQYLKSHSIQDLIDNFKLYLLTEISNVTADVVIKSLLNYISINKIYKYADVIKK